MNIEEILETFRNNVVQVEIFRNLAKETTKKEILRFSEIALADAKQSRDEVLHYESYERIGYYDPASGVYTSYGGLRSTPNDRILQLIKQKNRQYGWLLVEAWEEFEDYLERTYAWLGNHNWQSWKLREIANVTHEQLSKNPFSWYLEKVRENYSRNPKNILKRFRAIFPEYKKNETINRIDTNMRVSVELIANLRHKIVHARGTVSDRSGFIERVLSGAGVWNNGNPSVKNRTLVESCLSREPDECFVQLIEIPIELPEGTPPKAQRILNPQVDICSLLISDLVAQAVLINSAVKSYPQCSTN